MRQLFSAVAGLVMMLWAAASWAQSVYVQIEAHPTLPLAQSAAQDYATRLEDVNGYRFTTGWFVIALGPYDLQTAVARLNALKAQRAIPNDSYLVDRNAYSQQFFPAAGSVQAPVAAAPATPDAGTDTGTETAAAEPQPAPEPEPEPEETRREALRSEGQLTRQEKFNLQIALQWFGFYQGAIDAAFGPGTRNSMAGWQTSKGYEPTGVLTTRQRAELTGAYEDMLASLGLALTQDNRAGIELELPTAMVSLDRYEAPFAHYTATSDDGVRVLLISQAGDENTLLGLYDIMQTLKIVPLEGDRRRRANQFTLTGENAEIRSHTYAVLDGGEIKGFTLIWPKDPSGAEDRRFNLALKAMQDSFRPIAGTVLPDATGEGTLDQSLDLISGLEIRRPEASRSGFFINAAGLVLTSDVGLASCGRLTLDELYEADIVAQDAGLGVALLKPREALAPIDFARLQAGVPRLRSEVAVSGYSFEGLLGAPTLTFGTFEDVKGLRGETTLKRLALNATPGDTGGPVFDASGAVFGLLLPEQDPAGKQLPDGVRFATDSLALAEFLSANGVSPAAADSEGAMTPEALTRQAADMTVLVSCWAE